MPPEFLDREWRWGQRLGRGLWTAGGLLLGGPKRRWAVLIGGTVLIAGAVLWSRWGLAGVLSSLLSVTFGVPAPGQPLNPTTWTMPQNGLWEDLMSLSRVAVGASVVGLLLLTVRVTMISDIAVRRAELKRLGKTAALVATTWTAVPFVLHLLNELAQGLAPSPEQLLDALGATSAGIAVVGIVAWFQPFFVAVGVLSTLILRALIIVGFLVWPIAWVLRSVESPLAGVIGRSVTAVLPVAVATKLLQALGAAVVVWLTVTVESVPFRVTIFVAGVVGVFVALPIVMLRHAEALMHLPVAFAPSERQVGQYVDESAARVGQVHKSLVAGHQRVNDWRTTDSRDIFDTQFDDWRADASDDSDAGWFGGVSGDDSGVGWFGSDGKSDDADDSGGWLDGWITHEFPGGSFTSAEWSRRQTQVNMGDGVDGPTSENPDSPETIDARSEREQGRWDKTDDRH